MLYLNITFLNSREKDKISEQVLIINKYMPCYLICQAGEDEFINDIEILLYLYY